MKISEIGIESVDYLINAIPAIIRHGSSGHKRLQEIINLLENYKLVEQRKEDYQEFLFWKDLIALADLATLAVDVKDSLGDFRNENWRSKICYWMSWITEKW